MANVLTRHPFFDDVDPRQVADLRQQATEVSYRQGERIFAQGSEPEGLYLVLSGEVSFRKRLSNGEMHTVSQTGAGSYFGEIGIITDEPRSLEAVAMVDCLLAFIPREALLEYLKRIPGPMEKILRALIAHLHQTTNRYVLDILRKEKMALVGNMVNTIVHDFKNPFSLISLSAQILAQKHQDPHSQKLCANIEKQIQRMVEMAQELSEFSEGNQTLTRAPIRLRQLIRHFEELNAPLLEKSPVCITFDLPDVTLHAEAPKLLRVFQNLVTNALEAFPPEQRDPRLTVSGETADDGRHVILRIEDNGPGIPVNIRETFWEPFVTSGKSRGTGLGSAIAKSIVEAHGGSINFQTGNNGTSFTIRLPLYSKS